MAKMVLKFTFDADVIEVPDFIVKKRKFYQSKFDEWLFDENNDHTFWLYKKGKKVCVSYRAEAFVMWLNTYILADSEEKADIYDSNTKIYLKSWPVLNF